MTPNATPATPTNLPALLAVIEAAGIADVPVCLWGDPGIGKSSLIRAVAEHAGLPCEVVLGSLREPSDFAGLPVVTDEGVRFDAPTWARRLHRSEHGGILLLDELSTASPSVQKAMLSVVLDRIVGDLQLSRKVRVMAAANPPERAADGWDLTPPLANRFLHVDYVPNHRDWLDGLVAGFPVPTPDPLEPLSRTRRAVAIGRIAGFLNARPDLIQVYPDNDAATGRAWPSRRTWTMLAGVMAQTTTETADLYAAQGLVGIGAATELLVWLKNTDLPDPADLIADPTGFDWSTLAADRAWAALTGVVAVATATGTIKDWKSGWGPLAAAADHGHAAIAAANARALMLARPAGAMPPAAVRKFAPAIAAAGLPAA